MCETSPFDTPAVPDPPTTRPARPPGRTFAFLGWLVTVLLLATQAFFIAMLGSDLDEIEREIKLLRSGPSIPTFTLEARVALSRLIIEAFNANDWSKLEEALPAIDLDEASRKAMVTLLTAHGPVEDSEYAGQSVDVAGRLPALALHFVLTYRDGEVGSLVIRVADGGDQWPVRAFTLRE